MWESRLVDGATWDFCLWKFSNTGFCGMRARKYLKPYHTVIPLWIYRIPSELRSQAGLGLPSTVVGDHTGIVGAVCFFNIETIMCDFGTENQEPKYWKKRTTVLPTYVLVVLFWGKTVRILCLESSFLDRKVYCSALILEDFPFRDPFRTNVYPSATLFVPNVYRSVVMHWYWKN